MRHGADVGVSVPHDQVDLSGHGRQRLGQTAVSASESVHRLVAGEPDRQGGMAALQQQLGVGAGWLDEGFWSPSTTKVPLLISCAQWMSRRAWLKRWKSWGRLPALAGKPEDVALWKTLADRRRNNTRTMFVDGWFRDIDGRSNTPIILKDYFDVMMLSPLTCGVATNEQVEAVKPMFRAFLEKQKRWLEWPPALFTYVEAAWRAGVQLEAAEAVSRTAERVYHRTDARTVLFRQGTSSTTGSRASRTNSGRCGRSRPAEKTMAGAQRCR